MKKSKKITKHAAWDEVMALAIKYAFIRFTHGWCALLSIDEEKLKEKKKEEDKDKERVTPDSYYSLYGEEPGAGM